MYRLVIVEDERDVRSRIVSLIGKAQSGFEIVSEYETGIDAYDGIISDSPDLILTDIKIPYINGIELAKRVREVLPFTKIGIITGYNEFDYAKEAANLGVIGFVSKPVTLEDISSLLKKAEAVLDEEYLTSENVTQLEAFYENSLPIIRENDLNRLSCMTQVPPAFESKLLHSGISLDYRYFVVCVFDLDEAAQSATERHDLAFSYVRKFVDEDFCAQFDYELFNRSEKLCLLLKTNTPPDIKALELRLERIIQRVGRYSDMHLSVGVSSSYQEKDFNQMVKEAMNALGYRSVMGGAKVFSFGNSTFPISELKVDENKISKLGYTLRFQSLDDCIAAIDEIRGSLAEARESHYYAEMGILNALIRACDDHQGLFTSCGGADWLYRRLFEIKTVDESFDYLKKIAATVRALNDGIKVDSVQRSLQKITSYMDAHYCDADISFDSLSRDVCLSASYISALLKKNLNTSFVKLLTGLRMEKAKRLLADPQLKIIDVAEQLGYNDSYYFSHCFKKHTGVSPKDFRNETRNQPV